MILSSLSAISIPWYSLPSFLPHITVFENHFSPSVATTSLLSKCYHSNTSLQALPLHSNSVLQYYSVHESPLVWLRLTVILHRLNGTGEWRLRSQDSTHRGFICPPPGESQCLPDTCLLYKYISARGREMLGRDIRPHLP